MPKKEADTRRREVETIRRQLEDLGFPAHAFANEAPLGRTLREFAEEGWGATTTLTFREFGVKVMLQLSTGAHATSFARVRGLPPAEE